MKTSFCRWRSDSAAISDAMRGSHTSSETARETPAPVDRDGATPPVGAGAVLGFMGAGILALPPASGESASRAAFMADGSIDRGLLDGRAAPKNGPSIHADG